MTIIRYRFYLGTSSVDKLKRVQTQKYVHSSTLYNHTKATSYLNAYRKNQSIRNVSMYSYKKEMERLRIYQKEMNEALAMRKFNQIISGKILKSINKWNKLSRLQLFQFLNQ